MDTRETETPVTDNRPPDKAEDREVLRELKQKSDHLDEVVGEARDAVRKAQQVGTVGTEQPSGEAESGTVGGDADEESGDQGEAASTDGQPAGDELTDDRSAANTRESPQAE